MSGHSKWSSIKHKKSKEDAKRGKIFSKLSRYITVAAKEGGGNPDTNAALANAIEKAKSYNMSNDKIDIAVKRGTGDIEGVHYEKLLYEGYGPNGVALMVDIMTDNRNRTTAEIRHIFDKYGGKIGTDGCVSYLFKKSGYILISKEDESDEDKLLEIILEAGAEDLRSENSNWEIITDPKDFTQVNQAIKKAGITPLTAEVTMFPQNTINLNKDEARKVLKLVDALEDSDDVQEVYSNFDISEQVMDELAIE